jgi:hypothetical protein
LSGPISNKQTKRVLTWAFKAWPGPGGRKGDQILNLQSGVRGDLFLNPRLAGPTSNKKEKESLLGHPGPGLDPGGFRLRNKISAKP